jgi:Recombinase.
MSNKLWSVRAILLLRSFSLSVVLGGSTLQQIKEYLEEHQIKTATGKEVWATAVIQKILKTRNIR